MPPLPCTRCDGRVRSVHLRQKITDLFVVDFQVACPHKILHVVRQGNLVEDVLQKTKHLVCAFMLTVAIVSLFLVPKTGAQQNVSGNHDKRLFGQNIGSELQQESATLRGSLETLARRWSVHQPYSLNRCTSHLVRDYTYFAHISWAALTFACGTLEQKQAV